MMTLPACAANKTAACDAPPPFFARVEAAGRINPDSNGRPLPTVVQFIQIKDSTRMEHANFQRLWAEPKALLGEDFLQTAEFVVTPGQEMNHWLPRDPKAKFVAAVGLFRQPLGYSWFAVAKLPEVSKSQCEEPPAGERDNTPRSSDTQLRFKLQGYQIDFLRTSKGAP